MKALFIHSAILDLKFFPKIGTKQLSRGEICVQISHTPVNRASQGNYFLSKSHKLAVFQAKMGLQKQLW